MFINLKILRINILNYKVLIFLNIGPQEFYIYKLESLYNSGFIKKNYNK
jgi:hypothetical protein